MQLFKTLATSLAVLVMLNAFTASRVVAQEDTSSGVTTDSVAASPETESTSSEATTSESGTEGTTSESTTEASSTETVTAPPVEESGSSQTTTITGSVTDVASSEPLAGVSVVVKGTSVDELSDAEGKFSLEAQDSDVTLVFSKSGYATREVKTAGKTTINVSLSADALNLGTDVVVGYGTQKKTDLTGAVTSVRADDVVGVVSANIVSSLQGKASGVYVTQSSGRPGGAGLDIQIRGMKSLSASNKPLYVVDGLPLAPGSEDVMSEINPNDIESIDILKDAASAAIYGARGANGVVMITTKRGTASKEGQQKKAKITYDTYIGMTEVVQKLDMMSGPEWLAMKKEAYRTAGQDTTTSFILDPTQFEVYSKGAWVDWQEALFKKGTQMSHNVSVSGGTERLRALFSFGRFDEDGIFEKSKFSRNSGRLNVDFTPYEKFKMNGNVAISTVKSNVAGGDSTNKLSGQVSGAALSVLQTPAAKLYDDLGNLRLYVNNEKSIGNPLYLIQQSDDDNFRTRILANASATYEFIPGLSYKLSAGAEYASFKYGRFQTRWYNDTAGQGNNLAILGYGEGFNYSFDNILAYVKDINDANKMDVTLLYGIQGNKLDTMAASSKNIPTDLLSYNGVDKGAEPQPTKRTSDEWRLESYMGRARYTLMDKYLLTVSTRVDGSSRFGVNNKYGVFPSAALAWKIEQEPFMENATAIDLLKLRISAGTIGNQDIPSFRALSQAASTRYSFNNALYAGSNINTFGNPNLKWETTQQLNAGVDFSILNSLFDGSVEVYSAETKDLLLAKVISSANGDTSMYDNIGQTKSGGIEANLIARIFKVEKPLDFGWSISANIAAENTEVIKTSVVDANGNPADDVGNRWFIGQSLKVNYDYVFDGIIQAGEVWRPDPTAQPGSIKVKDLNGDSSITPADRKVLGSQLPKWYGGLTNTFQFMGIELSTFFVARQGVQRRNDITDRGMTGRNNFLKVDYWTPENPSNKFYRPNANNENPNYRSTLLYEDASYVAFKNIMLSYTVPQSLLNRLKYTGSLRVYLQGTNLKYWTEFNSYNPEASFTSYPMTRSYGFGLNAGF